jgi:hypothetical protein
MCDGDIEADRFLNMVYPKVEIIKNILWSSSFTLLSNMTASPSKGGQVLNLPKVPRRFMTLAINFNIELIQWSSKIKPVVLGISRHPILGYKSQIIQIGVKRLFQGASLVLQEMFSKGLISAIRAASQSAILTCPEGTLADKTGLRIGPLTFMRGDMSLLEGISGIGINSFLGGLFAGLGTELNNFVPPSKASSIIFREFSAA